MSYRRWYNTKNPFNQCHLKVNSSFTSATSHHLCLHTQYCGGSHDGMLQSYLLKPTMSACLSVFGEAASITCSSDTSASMARSLCPWLFFHPTLQIPSPDLILSRPHTSHPPDYCLYRLPPSLPALFFRVSNPSSCPSPLINDWKQWCILILAQSLKT